MGIIIGGNTLSGVNFNSLGETPSTPNVVTDGLILHLDAANFSSYINSNNYYDCGYGCQYYSSNPGCTNCNTQWKDMSGNGNDATLTNGLSASYGTNTGGGTMFFDGIDDRSYVTNNLGVLSSYTISFWARRDAENRMPISSRSSTNFYWYGDNSWRYVHGGVAGEHYYSKPTTISAGTWGHYTATYNGSNVTIYRQGIYQSQVSTSGSADFTSGLQIGYWEANGGYAWYGPISVVTMYNRGLSAVEVLQNFNNGRQRYGI